MVGHGSPTLQTYTICGVILSEAVGVVLRRNTKRKES